MAEESQVIMGDMNSCVGDMMASQHVQHVAIYSLHGDLLATAEPEKSLEENEFNDILQGFRRPLSTKITGINVYGKSYKVVVADGVCGILGKKGLPASGCSICLTNTLVIVGVHSDSMISEEGNEVIMRMGDFLRRKGI